MTISILALYTRRPDITPEQFRSYMEEHHVPLIKAAFGAHLPLSYTVRYPIRVASGVGDRLGAVTSSTGRADPNGPVVLVGQPSDVEWDCLGEMVFRDELHVQQGMAAINSPKGQEAKEDEEVFTVPEKLRVVLIGGGSELL
jgi:hypothetical protein